MVKLETLLPIEIFESLLEQIAPHPIKMIEFYQVQSIGLDSRKGTQYRGVKHTPTHHDKMKLEIWVEKEDLDHLVEKLTQSCSGLLPLSISGVEELRLVQGKKEED